MWKTPSEHVSDTMEAVMDADSGDYKRLPLVWTVGFNMFLAPTLNLSLYEESWKMVPSSIQTIQRRLLRN